VAGWLGGWLSCCCWLGGWLVAAGWLRGWLLAVLLMRLMRGMTLAAAGWLAGNQTKNPSKRNISLSVAELKVHEKNIQKRRRQAGGYKS